MPKEAEPIKIALVGTSCVGKTTLLDQFRQKFADNQSIGFVEEAARSFFESHTINKRFSAETQGQIQAIALADEQLAHCGGHGAILCDRSVIDAVVYVRAAEGGEDKKGSKGLLERVRFWLPTYNKFFLCDPSDIPYQTDDIRQEDVEMRQRFHDAFISFFQETGIPYELLSGTQEERIKRVEQILQEA